MKLTEPTNTLFVLMLGLLFARTVLEGRVIDIAFVVICALLVLYQLPFFLKYNRVFLVLWFLSLCMLCGRYFTGMPLGLLFTFNLFVCLFFTHAIDFGKVNPSVGYFYFYLATTYIVIKALLGFTPDEIFFGSKNSLSSILTCYLLLILILDRQLRKSIPIVPVLFVTIFSLWGTSRSGMIVSFILLIAIVFEILINLKYKKIIKKHRIIISVFVITLFVASDQIYQSIDTYTQRLQLKGLVSRDRSDINKAYFEQLTLKRVILGSDLYSIPVIVAQNVNPHNFYIFIHSGLGIIAIIMFFLILVYLWKLFQKGYITYGLILSAFLLKMSANTGARGITFFIFMMIVLESCKMFRYKN